MNKKKLVFATNNAHKLEEARQVVSDAFEIVSLAEIGCHDDIPETSDTLQGNALIKARWVKDKYGYDCFADDTGLMVDALDGAPGVYSARYAGPGCTPADNVELLLRNMHGCSDRNAHFSTVIAFVEGESTHTFVGRVDGIIAESPAGNAGFGYDPIFIPENSDLSFAEMSADEKNAISHRGRAMRKFCDFLKSLAIVAIILLCGFSLRAQQWRLHPSYDGQVEVMIDTPHYLYMLGTKQKFVLNDAARGNFYGTLFRYDKDAEEMAYLNSSNLISDDAPTAIQYNFDKNYLAIGYENGNIDLLYDSGEIVNVPGLMIADPALSKKINDFYFDTANGKIYAGADFGYLIIDDVSGEIDRSISLKVPVNSLAIHDSLLWIATGTRLLYGSLKANSDSMFSEITGLARPRRLYSLGGKGLYLWYGDMWNSYCSKIVKNGESYKSTLISKKGEVGITLSPNYLYLSSPTVIRRFDADARETEINLTQEDCGALATSYDGVNFWFSNGRHGVSQKKYSAGNPTPWTLSMAYAFPNASNAFMCSSMAYHSDYGMLVRNHGYDHNFGGGGMPLFGVDDLISAYRNMNWTPMSTTYRTDMKGLLFDNPSGITIDPNNTNHVYAGSLRSGLLRIDMREPHKSLHMSKPNDITGGNGNAGFIAVAPDNTGDWWADRCTFAQPQFDNYGNMWTIFTNGIEDVTFELWVWTPEKRLSSTNASNFKDFYKMKISDIQAGSTPKVIPFKTKAYANYMMLIGGAYGEPMLLYNHNGTPENRSDDSKQKYAVLTDQDGNTENFLTVYAYYEDMQTGLMWLSTNMGVVTLNLSDFIKGNGSVRRIKVPRNDGTNLADYLLNGVTVNYISADASGRKWFATTGAGLVCTSSDGRSIISTYNSENSSLPGDIVYAAEYNPESNSMMVSTDQGLCELFLSGTSSDASSDVKCWPNPVRPDYYGSVTIEGLPDEAMVKIVDARGNLVRECGAASGGKVEWDVTNLFHKRVPGGVYFVLASNGPSQDAYAKVSKILVVD